MGKNQLNANERLTLLSIAGLYPRVVDANVASNLGNRGLVEDLPSGAYKLTKAGERAIRKRD